MLEIFRALKSVVEESQQQKSGKLRGRFQLSGSANVMAPPKMSDSLVGTKMFLCHIEFPSQILFQATSQKRNHPDA